MVALATTVHAAAAAACLVAVLGAATTAHAAPITIDWVTVSDPGNTADTSTYGAVADPFRIMKFEFTNQQYTAFLNSVAATDTYSLYNTNMGSNGRGGITRSGSSGSFTYSVRSNMGDKPVNFVSWFDAARVANWLQNGQGSGDTETGAYTLSGATSGTAPAVNSGASFYIPTENQWYKAAFYNQSLNSGSGGYATYGNGSSTIPTPVSAGPSGDGSSGPNGNFVNYRNDADWNSLNGNVTTVGTNGSPSSYGLFDMSGNAWEWNDLTGTTGLLRGLRGGGWDGSQFDISSSDRSQIVPDDENNYTGFRLAAVPEPTTLCMALAGLASGGFSMWRRRKRA